ILKKNKIVVMKGHGSFAIGNSLEEALNWTTSLEASTRIIFYRLVAESFNNL
ncbi:MAG: class II aldolase/adducin family protein, partial [Actinomycetia bacterium]|nr:class II aldolase/adducin family protein [Actinomycetes bacterium]